MSVDVVNPIVENDRKLPHSSSFSVTKMPSRATRRGPRRGAGFLLIFIVLIAIIGSVASVLIPPCSAILALILFILSHVYAYRVFPHAFIILMPVFLVRLLEMIAAIALNTGVPLPELGMSSRPTSSFFWLSILYSTWPILTAWVMPSVIDVEKTKAAAWMRGRSTSVTWFAWLAFAYGFAILAFYAVYGAPLFDENGKYAFYSSAGSRILNALVRYRLGMVCLVGFLVVAIRSGPVRFGLSGLYIALFVLGADKVTAPILAISFGLIPFAIMKDARILFNTKVLLLGTLCVGAALGIYFAGRAALAQSSDAAWDSILVRLPAQSQMWYVVSESSPPIINLPSPQTEEELVSLLPFGDTDARTRMLGQTRMLEDLAGKRAYQRLSEGGASFIMILYPYIMRYYGVVALIFANFIFLAYYLLLSKALVKSMISLRPATLLITALLLQGVVASFVTGNLTSIISTNIYFLFLIAFVLYAIRSSSVKISSVSPK